MAYRHDKYQREYYRKNKNKAKYKEKIKLYNRLRSIRETTDKIRNCILIKETKKVGHSCHVVLPKNWRNRTVIILDKKLFTKDIRRGK